MPPPKFPGVSRPTEGTSDVLSQAELARRRVPENIEMCFSGIERQALICRKLIFVIPALVLKLCPAQKVIFGHDKLSFDPQSYLLR